MNEQAEEEAAGGDHAAQPMGPGVKANRKFRFEDGVHFFVYIVYLLFGLVVMSVLRSDILKKGRPHGIATGWPELQLPQDQSNEELRLYGMSMERKFGSLVMHVLLSTVCRLLWPGKHMRATAVWGMGLMFNYQALGAALVFAMFGSFYVMSKFNTRHGTWALALAWLGFLHEITKMPAFEQQLEYLHFYELIILMSWGILRGISFNCSRIAATPQERDHLYTLAKYLGYCFYLPTMVFGPHIEYGRYLHAWEQPDTYLGGRSTPRQLYTFAKAVLRAQFWWFFMQFALHYLYIHYVVIEGVSVLRLVGPPFGLHAIGYFMGQFFYLFYVVCYGVGIAFATYDGMRPPRRPRCIGHIHYYSDMWKYFDEGLYEFLWRHIYCQLCSPDSPARRKLYATAATFLFVYMWHGCFAYVLIWSALNFACLVGEKCLRAFMESRWYDAHVNSWFGPRGQQRVRALLATQIFIPAAFSNVYFIGGVEVGNYLMANAYLNGFWSYAALTFCSYCFFQCSEYIMDKQNE